MPRKPVLRQVSTRAFGQTCRSVYASKDALAIGLTNRPGLPELPATPQQQIGKGYTSAPIEANPCMEMPPAPGCENNVKTIAHGVHLAYSSAGLVKLVKGAIGDSGMSVHEVIKSAGISPSERPAQAAVWKAGAPLLSNPPANSPN